jgi:hypothetical protein
MNDPYKNELIFHSFATQISKSGILDYREPLLHVIHNRPLLPGWADTACLRPFRWPRPHKWPKINRLGHPTA